MNQYFSVVERIETDWTVNGQPREDDDDDMPALGVKLGYSFPQQHILEIIILSPGR